MTIDLRTMLAFSCYWCPLQHNDIIKAISVTCDCFYHPIISDETAGTLCVLYIVCRYKFWLNWHAWNHSRMGLINIYTSWTFCGLYFVSFQCFFLFFFILLFFFSFVAIDFFIRIYYNLMYLKVKEVHLAHFSTYKRITETQKFLKLLNLGWISARGFLDWDWVTFSH